MWKKLEERTEREEMSPPYLPEKKSRPWMGEGCQGGRAEGAGERAAASRQGELQRPILLPAALTGEQGGPQERLLKMQSQASPQHLGAIRHTKVGETALWMTSPKDRAFSQACFLFRVPTGHRAEKGLQPFDKWEQRPGGSRIWPQSQGFSGCPSINRDSQASGARGGWPTTQSWTKSRTVGSGRGRPEPRAPASPHSPRPYTCG